jgi:hypothetical protein
MKKILLTALQFVIFLLVFAVGSFAQPFHLRTSLNHSSQPSVTHLFVWDGLLLSVAFYVLILVIEALRKRLRAAAPWTTLAFVLAAVVGLAMKFGFITLEP